MGNEKKRKKGEEGKKRKKGLTSECDEPFRYSLTRTGPHTRARIPREPRRVAGNIACTLSFRGFLPSDVDARRSAGSHAVPPLHRRRVPSGCLRLTSFSIRVSTDSPSETNVYVHICAKQLQK